jgi:alpha-glucosidase (family GH31 glycosyl hydrolase)
MWTDIDYMDNHRDFSWDPVNFPENKVRQFVDSLHANGQQYVVIVDPGIANIAGYAPYEEGLQKGIFIKDSSTGQPFVGNVWPGYFFALNLICSGDTVFPDFMNNLTTDYWTNQVREFLSRVPVDGLWIDMNEVSYFHSHAALIFQKLPVQHGGGASLSRRQRQQPCTLELQDHRHDCSAC